MTGLDQGLHFLILGALEVWSGANRLALGGARAERVLAILLLEGNQVVPVSRLVEAAWDEEPPPTAAHQVRKIVADLRRRMPGGADVIVTDGPGYRIVLGEDQLDLTVFEIRLSRAREADAARLPRNAIVQLEAALDLWRGTPLAGMDNQVIRAAVVSLEEARLAAVEWLNELRLSLGETRSLVAELRALHAAHPLRETICGHLMLALYRSGRQAEALAVFDAARRLLADDLGIDPGPDLARLHERILRNDPELGAPPRVDPPPPAPPTVIQVDAPPPRTLPYDLSDFVGRAEQLDQLTARVKTAARNGLAIVTIDGMAGMGKTTLAVHAAHRLAGEFPDGQIFVDLCGFTPGREPMEPVEALNVLLRALGVPSEQIPDDPRACSALWRVQAAGKKLLVLLDNAAETGQVRPLLPGAGHSLVMVTSRPRLTGLDGAVTVSLDLMSPEEGRALATRILGPGRLAGAEQNTRELVEVCGRLPLALRIAAARLHNRPHWTIGYLVHRLRDEERRLGELAVDDRSVAAAIGLSYESVGADHRRMFRRLGLHPAAEFDAYTAAALTDVPVEKAEVLLEDLLDVRLLIQWRLGRYAFHDIVRSYARGQAATEEAGEERAAAMYRLLDYYLAVASAAADLVQPGRYHIDLTLTHPPAGQPPMPDRSAAMAWFDDNRPALMAAIRYAAAHDLFEHACHLPRSVAYYLQLRGYMADLQSVMETAVESARRLGDRTFEGRSLVNLSIPHWHFGRFDTALDCAERALAIAEEVGDQPNQGMCVGRIALLLGSLGRFTEALDYYQRALAIHTESGNRREESSALAGQSLTLAALGRYEQALHSARRSVDIDRELGDRSGEVIGLVNVASAYMDMDDLAAARSALDQALHLARAVGTPNGEAVVTAHYAELFRRLGQHRQAYDWGRRALHLLQTVRRPAIAATVENTLGLVHSAQGEHSLALARHEQARRLAEEIGFRTELARALDGMAHALAGLGETAAARQHWLAAAEHYEDMGLPAAATTRQHLATDP